MATSTAVARVASARNIGYYEVPTGWKYFVNLMDSKRITFCGEESFGTGSSHIREKDGIWAVLFWLNIIAATGKSVEEITREHWRKYGRSYYLRFDFDGIPTDTANKLMSDLEAKLPPLNGQNSALTKLPKQKLSYTTIRSTTPRPKTVCVFCLPTVRALSTVCRALPQAVRRCASTLKSSAAASLTPNRGRWSANC